MCLFIGNRPQKVGYHTEVCQNNKSTFVRMFDFHIQNLQYMYQLSNCKFCVSTHPVDSKLILVYNTAKSLLRFELSDF